MPDQALLRHAERLGYAVFWKAGRAYYAQIEHEKLEAEFWSFPFKSEDEAALAAITNHEQRHRFDFACRVINEVHRETLARLAD